MENEGKSFDKAYDKAMRLIQIRPHTQGEIRRKLALKGFNAGLAEEVTAKLVELGLINDAEFVAVFLENLIRFKTFGFYGLKMKLMQRGITATEAESLLKANFPPEKELVVAERLVAKAKNPNKIKLAQKLQRKGFRSEVIRKIIDS